MYSIDTTEQFEKSFRRCIRNGKNPDDLWEVVEMLAENGFYQKSLSLINLKVDWQITGSVI